MARYFKDSSSYFGVVALFIGGGCDVEGLSNVILPYCRLGLSLADHVAGKSERELTSGLKLRVSEILMLEMKLWEYYHTLCSYIPILTAPFFCV